MNIEFDTYKQKLNDCRPALDGLAESLNMTGMRNELERLHAMQEAPGFWDDPEKSQKVAIKVKQTEAKIERYEKMVAFLPPRELIQQYQEKRASLNADIDRILAQITDILGIDITEEGDE